MEAYLVRMQAELVQQPQAAETARGNGPNDCSPKESYESRNVVLGSWHANEL